MTEREHDDLAETTVDSQRIYEGRVLNLRVDEVRMPSGRRTTREVVEHRGAVAAVALAGDGKVFLVRQWRYAVGGATLELPAGTLEAGESPEQCIHRELIEEIGQRAGSIEPLVSLFVSPGYSNEMIHLFVATDLTPQTAEADEDEDLRVVQMPVAEALETCRSGELPDGKTVAGLLCAAAKLGW